MKRVRDKAIRNSYLMGIVFALGMGSGFITSVVLGNVLSVEELGRYGEYLRGYSWLAALAVFALPPVLVRYVAELRGAGHLDRAWTLLRQSLLIQSITVAATLLVGAVFLLLSSHSEELSVLAVLLAFATIAYSTIFESFLRGLQRFRDVAYANAASSAIRIACLALLFIAGGTAAVGLGILAIGNAALLVYTLLAVYLVYTRRTRKRRKRLMKELRRRIIEYAGSMGLSGFMSLIVWNYVEVFLLGYFWLGREGRTSELAFYTLAISLAALPLRFGKTVSSALLPLFSELYGARDEVRLHRGYHQITVLTAAFGSFVCLMGIALADATIGMLFPDSLSPTVAPFRLLLIPALFVSMNHAGSAALPAIEGHRFSLASTTMLAPLVFVLGFFLIPTRGAIGAATVNAIVQSLAVVLTIWYISRRRRFGFPMVATAKILLASGVSASLAWLTSAILHLIGAPATARFLLGGFMGAVWFPMLLRPTHAFRAADLPALLAVGKVVPKPFRSLWKHLATYITSP